MYTEPKYIVCIHDYNRYMHIIFSKYPHVAIPSKFTTSKQLVENDVEMKVVKLLDTAQLLLVEEIEYHRLLGNLKR